MFQPTLARVVHTLQTSTRRKSDVPDSDQELLVRFVRNRDEDAFRALVHRHGQTVLSACRQVLTDPADADDAFQATFLVLLKKAKRLAANPAPLGGWLYAVAHRLAVRCRADRHRRSAREAEAARRAERTTEPADLSWREATDALHEELNALPDKYRLPLLLCGVQGLTRDEAAEELGTTVGVVRGQLERGRTLLERRIAKRGIVLSAGWLAVVMASSRAAGGPSHALIDLAARLAGGHLSPTVAALATGAFPMIPLLKPVAVAVAAVMLAFGLAVGFGTPQPVAHADEKPAVKIEKKADPKAEVKPAAAKERTITGTVVGPNGKPLQAELALHWTEGTVQPLGKTNPDGTFKLTVPFQKKNMGGELVASAAGCGPDFHHHGYDYIPASVTPNAELVFALPKERAIKGRVLNQEGKPVAGATVAAFNVYAYDSDASLDTHLKNWAKRADGNPLGGDRGMQYPKTGRPPTAHTDRDGRFELGGFGAGQMVQLKLSGDGIAVKGLMCVNREGFDPAPLIQAAIVNAGKNHKFNARWLPYGSDFTAVVEPEKIVRGTVTDQDGKPQAGVRVQATRTTSTELTDHWYWHEAKTDREGQYVIRGLRKYPAYTVTADPPSSTGLMYCTASAGDTVGYEPITIDVKCAKGVVVTGTVTNKATGQPIRSSDIRVEVLKDNSFVGQFPAFTDRPPQHWTDEDGKFRIVTIPGPVLLIASGGGKNDSEYKPPLPDPDYPQYFTESEGVLLFKSHVGRDHLNGCWCKVLNAKAAGDEVTVKIELEPATRTSVNVVDADGKPVTGCKATGMTHVEYANPTASADADTLTVFNLDAKKERLLAVIHEKRKLVGMLTLTADAKKPVVKLGSGGSVTGRAVDADGKPLAGLTVQLSYSRREAQEASAVLKKSESISTDANGEFRIDTLFPGQEFHLAFTRGKTRFGSDQAKATKHTVAKHGDTLKLGDLKLDASKDREQ